MSKRKKVLNKKVTAFCKQFDSDLKARLGEDFEYSFEKERVQFPLEVTEQHDFELFKIFIKKIFDYDVPNVFMMSLLHEIGHHFTGENFTEEDEALYFERNAEITERIMNDEGDQPFYDYYALPQEMAATRWAVDVYRNNEKAINKAWKQIKKALKEYHAP